MDLSQHGVMQQSQQKYNSRNNETICRTKKKKLCYRYEALACLMGFTRYYDAF